MRILHLIDSFDGDSCARELQVLAPKLTQADRVEVCCLGPETVALSELRRSGVLVHALEWTRWIDPSVLWNLRAVLNESAPDTIHVWRLPALRALALIAMPMLDRVVVSAALPATGTLAWWDRKLLERVRCVALAGESDQAYCTRHDVRASRLSVVSPAICHDESNSEFDDQRSSRAANIVYLGRLDRLDGARHAVWAYDILRHSFPNTRLQMVGAEGTSRTVRDLAEGLEVKPWVDFLGVRSDLSNLLRDASVVWLPRTANCGRLAALDAMAHGRVVIASDVPCLREVIRDHETGFLVPAGNIMELARRTRLPLEDVGLRERMERAARSVVEQRFALDDVVSQWRELYRTIAA